MLPGRNWPNPPNTAGIRQAHLPLEASWCAPGRLPLPCYSSVVCFPVGIHVLPGRNRYRETPMCTTPDAVNGVLPGRNRIVWPTRLCVLSGMKRSAVSTRLSVLPGRISPKKPPFHPFQHLSQEILRHRCASRYPFVCFPVGCLVLSSRELSAFRYENVCFPVALYKEARDHEIKRQEIRRRRPCGPCGKTVFDFLIQTPLKQHPQTP